MFFFRIDLIRVGKLDFEFIIPNDIFELSPLLAWLFGIPQIEYCSTEAI